MGVKFVNIKHKNSNYAEIYLCYIQGQWWKMLVNVTTLTKHGYIINSMVFIYSIYVKCAPVGLLFVLITAQSDTFFRLVH